MKKYYYEEYRDLYDHSNKMRKHLLSLSEPYINDKDIGLYFKVLISNSEDEKDEQGSSSYIRSEYRQSNNIADFSSEIVEFKSDKDAKLWFECEKM